MVRVNSLAYMLLLGVLTLAVGAMLYVAFDEALTVIFDRPDWRADPSTAVSRNGTAEQVNKGQRTLETLWAAVPVLGAVAIGFAVIATARRDR